MLLRVPVLAALAALTLLSACERKPATPPKPSTEMPAAVEPRPVDLRVLT
jgi:hypothetical protein